jgi:hypothetical protein
MNFAVFSDDPCHIKYVESIAIPIGHTQVELYGIEPGARTQWIVVKQLDGNKATFKVFLRHNERFLENEIDSLPQETRSQIMQRFPQSGSGTEAAVARQAIQQTGQSGKEIDQEVPRDC